MISLEWSAIGGELYWYDPVRGNLTWSLLSIGLPDTQPENNQSNLPSLEQQGPHTESTMLVSEKKSVCWLTCVSSTDIPFRTPTGEIFESRVLVSLRYL